MRLLKLIKVLCKILCKVCNIDIKKLANGIENYMQNLHIF